MVKHFTRGCRVIILLLLLAFAYAAIWLQGGARDMNWSKGFLTNALNPPGAPYSINIGDVSLRWQHITEFGDIRVSNMQMARKDGGIFMTVNDVNLTLDPLGFLPNRRLIHGLKLDQPRLYMTRDEEGVLRLGVDGVPETLPVSDLTGFFASDDPDVETKRSRVPFRALEVNHASLLFTDAASGADLKSDNLTFKIGRDGHNLDGNLTMPFTYRGKPGSIGAVVGTQTVSEMRVLNAQLQNVPSELICLLAPCPPDITFDGSVSGKLTLRKPPRAGVFGGTVSLTTEDALLTAPKIFPEPLELKKAEIVASADNDLKTITIAGARVEVPDTILSAKANLQQGGDGWHARGEAACTKLRIGKLYKYWPLPMAHDSREWVTTQLKNGYAESGELKFDLLPADMGDSMRDEAIAATVLARDMEIAYIPGFPNITDGNGTAHFTGKRIVIDIDSGKMMDATSIKPSKLVFTNLDIPATPMTTDLNISASASNVATILKLPPFTFDDGVNLDPAKITGSADANIKLAFDAFSKDKPSNAGQVDFSNIGYDVKADLHNVSQPNLVSGRDINGFEGKLYANKDGANLSGAVKLDGSNVDIDLKDGPSEHDTVLGLKGTLATKQFSKFGIPPIEQLGDGTLGLDVELHLGKDAQTLDRANLDLTNVPMQIKQISWSKPAATKAALSISPGGAPNKYAVKLDAPGLSIGNADLTLTDGMNDVLSANLPEVKTDKNDFTLNYSKKPDGYAVTLRGAALDVSDSYDNEDKPVNNQPDKEKAQPKPDDKSILADFPALDLTVDLGKLVLVKENPITALKGTLRCDKIRCNTADFSAKTGEGNFKASINSSNGARQLIMSDSDAGSLLRALDASNRLFGGQFSLNGKYDDTKTPAPFFGRLQIAKFKLKNSEILARIISIGSLSGLVNVLTGQGIDFTIFKADIGALGGVINVTNGKTEGNALGLTVEGSVDTNASRLDLKGVVAPISSINSLLGKIPLLGAIAGGEEGLIAFNYTIKGPMSDPDVFVNPLSGLTPGFLRGIFSVGDKKVDAVPELKTEKPTVPADEVPETPVPWPSSDKKTK